MTNEEVYMAVGAVTTFIGSALAGAFAVIKAAVSMRESLENRLDKIESELTKVKGNAVTHEELADAIKSIEDKNDKFYLRMDTKIDSIKSDMMWLMQAVSRDRNSE